jgi:DNA-binding NarL/FixJ family response regulator
LLVTQRVLFAAQHVALQASGFAALSEAACEVLGLVELVESAQEAESSARARLHDAREDVSKSLSRRELAVVELAARGYANKHIAFELGIAERTASTYLARSKVKLRVGSRVELICLVRAAGRGSFPVPRTQRAARLTEAEQAVIAGILQGKTNARMARERERSVRTIANQVAAAFRKLCVHSRSELAAALAR